MLGRDVERAAREVGHEPIALARVGPRHQRPRGRRAGVHRALPGRGHQLRGVDQRGRRRGARGRGHGGQRARRRATSRPRPPRSVPRSSTPPPTTSSTAAKAEGYVESDAVGPISGYGRSKLAGEREVAAANPRHWIVRSSWLFGVNGRNFVETMLGLAQDREEVVVVRDQIGCPTYTGHLAAGLVRLLDGEDYGMHHMAGGGRCSWYDFAVEIFKQAGVDCRVLSMTSDMLDRPAPRPAVLGAGQRARAPGAAAGLAARAWPTTSPSAPRRRCGHEDAGHRRRRLHRLELRAPRARGPSRGRGRGARQAHLRGPRRDDPGPARRRPLHVRAGRHRRPGEPCARRSRAATRSSTSRPSRTSTARSRSPATSSRPTCTGPTCCSRRRAAPASSATCRSRPTRSTARSRRARSPSSSPLDPSSPYSASKAGGDLLVGAYCHTYGMNATVCRASNNYGPYQYPEKLIPLCVLNALHGDPLPVYGDGMQVRNWLYVTDHCRGDRHRAALGQGRRDLQHRRPGRAAEHRRRAHDHRADGRRRVADPVRQGPPRPRPPLLASARRRRGRARLEGARSPFAEGIAATVDWYRKNAWWWEPIRSGDYRDYYQRQYGQELRS